MKNVICGFCGVVVIIFSFFSNVNAEEARDWRSEYCSAIYKYVDQDSMIMYFKLADLDVDGVPELILGAMTGNSGLSRTMHILSYKNGKLIEVPFEKDMPVGGNPYDLYQNDITKELRIESGYFIRAGILSKRTVDIALYTYTDTVSYEDVFVHSVEDQEENYYIMDDAFHNPLDPMHRITPYKTTELNYDYGLKNYHNGWNKIDKYNSVEMYEYTISKSKVTAFVNSYTDGPALAVPSTHNVTFNGNKIEPNKPAGYNIAGRNFYKLRDIAEVLKDSSAKFSISYNNQEQAIYIKTGEEYSPVGGELSGEVKYEKNLLGIPSEDKIYINGKPVELKAYKINGNNYFELRDLGENLGFSVDWDAETSTVLIEVDEWDYPMKGSSISQAFRNKHLGVDIVSDTDEKVYSAAGGVVVAVGSNGTTQDAETIEEPKGNGYFIVIEHELQGKKIYSFYAHLKEGSFCVKEDDIVTAGQPIAVFGNTGNSTGRHVHFAITDTLKKNGAYFGYPRDGSTVSGNVHKESSSGVRFYNPVYVIENQKLPES